MFGDDQVALQVLVHEEEAQKIGISIFGDGEPRHCDRAVHNYREQPRHPHDLIGAMLDDYPDQRDCAA